MKYFCSTCLFRLFVCSALLIRIALSDGMAKSAVLPADAYTLSTSAITHNSAVLVWTGSSAITSFDIRWRKVGESIWTITSEINDTRFLLTDLDAGQQYEWQLLAAETQTWIGSAVFATIYSCYQPYLYSVYSASATGAALQWSSTSNEADRSFVEVRVSGTPTWTTYTVPATTTNYTLTGLIPETAYEGRVRTNCSPYSNPVSFTTSFCTPKNLASVSSTTQASLNWKGGNTINYTVRWRPQGSSWITASDRAVGSWTLDNLTPNTVYEWQLQWTCADSNLPETSPVQSFTTVCSPPTSVFVKVVTANRITLGWQSPYVYGALGSSTQVRYRPQLPVSSSWSEPITLGIDQQYPPVQTQNYGTVAGLVTDTGYELQLRSVCPSNISTAYAEPPISASTSSCTSVASNLAISDVGLEVASLIWSGDYNLYYATQYRVSGTSSWSQVGPGTSPGNMYVSLTNLKPGTVYEWRVVTYCATSPGPTTPVQTFTTAACQTNRLSAFGTSNVDYASATVYWSEPYPRVGQYSIRYRSVGSSTYTTLPLASYSGVSLTGLTANTVYEWQVAVVCDAGATSLLYSSPNTFTTVCRQRASGLSTNTNSFTSINLNWYSDVPSGGSVTYQVRYRPVGEDWTTQTLTTSSYYPTVGLTGLITDKVYEWDVVRQCEAGVMSVVTAGTSFTTSCRNTLSTAYSQYVTTTRASLTFYFYNYSNQYQLRYRQVGVSDWTTLLISNNSYTLTNLAPNTRYEWQAAAVCAVGFQTDFSPSQTFTTTTNCNPLTNLYTAVTELSASLQWPYNANLEGYNIQYRSQGAESWATARVDRYQSSYYLRLSPGAYEWRIQADCGSGQMADFSAVQSFSTTCYFPTGLTVADISSYGATVSWANGNYSVLPTYNLQWRQAGSTNWTTETGIQQTRYSLTGLMGGTVYETRIQAQCGTVQTAYTNARTFGAVCSAPTALTTTTLYYFAEPGRTLSWSVTAGVTYTARWRRVAEAGQPAAEWIVREGIGNGSLLATQFLPGTYEWQVQGRCVDGSKSAFIGGPSFVIPVCPADQLTRYASRVENTAATLYYNFVGVTELRWRQSGAAAWNVISQTTSTYHSLTGLTENTAYEWQVRVLCSGGQPTEFGSLQRFATSCGQPTNLMLLCTFGNRAQVGWSGPESSTYEVQWRQSGGASWTTSVVSGTVATLADLSNSGYYEWRVRAACSPQSSTVYSTISSFYVGCSSPTALTITSNASCEYVLRWQHGCVGNASYRVRISYNSGSYQYFTVTDTFLNLGNLAAGINIDAEVTASCNGVASYSTYYYTSTRQCLPNYVSRLNQSVEATSATLYWENTCGQSVVRWRPAGGTWTSAQTSQLTYQLTSLMPDAVYEWQVRSTCESSEIYSAVSFFRTGCTSPLTEIYGITAGADNIRYFFAFNGSSYEVRYRIEGGSWITQPATSSPVLLTGLAPNTRYEIQLRRRCTADSWTNWSPPRYATTACPQPTNLFASSLAETSAQVNWDYDTYAVSQNYGRTLQYRPLGTSTWLTADLSGLPTATKNSYALTGLSQQTTYEWQILYNCGSGGASGMPNQPVTFRTIGLAGPCAQMATVITGPWNDAATWSCGRVPLLTDSVLIRHRVTVPATATGVVKQIRYESNGVLRYNNGAQLKVER